MEICKDGVWFNHYGDNILWRWPWKRHGVPKLRSSAQEKDFTSLREYWQFLGTVETSLRKLRITSLKEEELLFYLIRGKFKNEAIVVLTNLDTSVKPGEFWFKVPLHYRKHFLNDVTILICKEPMEVYDLCDSIEPRFATAYGFIRGDLVRDNRNDNTTQ